MRMSLKEDSYILSCVKFRQTPARRKLGECQTRSVAAARVSLAGTAGLILCTTGRQAMVRGQTMAKYACRPGRRQRDSKDADQSGLGRGPSALAASDAAVAYTAGATAATHTYGPAASYMSPVRHRCRRRVTYVAAHHQCRQ